MKLEEILPEIRRGRRFRIKGVPDWWDNLADLAHSEYLNDTWELEPEPREFYLGRNLNGLYAVFSTKSAAYNYDKQGDVIYVREVL